eukprot:5318739-Amphidinium_carterae.1
MLSISSACGSSGLVIHGLLNRTAVDEGGGDEELHRINLSSGEVVRAEHKGKVFEVGWPLVMVQRHAQDGGKAALLTVPDSMM